MEMIRGLVGKLLGGFTDRVLKSWKSSAIGAAVFAAIYELGVILNCDMSLLQPAVVAGVAAAPLVFGKDEMFKRLLDAMKAPGQQAAKSAAVVAEAQALQEQAAKDAGLFRNGLPVVLLALLLAGCQGFAVDKIDLGHNVWSDGTKDVHGEEIPGEVFKIVEIYKTNVFGKGYYIPIIYKCPTAGAGDCMDVTATYALTVTPSGFEQFMVPVGAAATTLGGAAMIRDGLSRSGSQTNISGGNATATGGDASSAASATSNAAATAGAAASGGGKHPFK